MIVGMVDEAYADCLLLARFAELLVKDESHLSKFAGSEVAAISHSSAGVGVQSGKWDDAQLAELGQRFQDLRLLTTWMEGLPRWRAEKIDGLVIEIGSESGVSLKELIKVSRYLGDWQNAWSPGDECFEPRDIPKMPAFQNQKLKELADAARYIIGDFLTIEARVETMSILIAVERWQQKHGAVPTELALLADIPELIWHKFLIFKRSCIYNHHIVAIHYCLLYFYSKLFLIFSSQT
jgi:hypothetical protein